MRFELREPGLLVVEYATGNDLLPAHQGELVEALEREVALGPTCLVCLVSPNVKGVDMSATNFWLSITSRLPMRGLVIVTQSLVVRAAARGFAMANALRKLSVKVEVFASEAEALRWAQATLKA
jgi:hypothetical protein